METGRAWDLTGEVDEGRVQAVVHLAGRYPDSLPPALLLRQRDPGRPFAV